MPRAYLHQRPDNADNCIAKVSKDFLVTIACYPEPALGPRNPRFYCVQVTKFDPKAQGGWLHWPQYFMLPETEAIWTFNNEAKKYGIAMRISHEDFKKVGQ